ncbi:hypothetical protein R6G99_06655 [Actinotignum timonense]|nr:hypothetical protein [Actinotignum timonense]
MDQLRGIGQVHGVTGPDGGNSRADLAEILTRLHGSGLTLVMVLHERGELAHLVGRDIQVSDGYVHGGVAQ